MSLCSNCGICALWLGNLRNMIFKTCIGEIILKFSDRQKEEGTPGRTMGLCKKGHWRKWHI